MHNYTERERDLFEMKGMSKWVDTAMRPVPERSHILKTCPTNAGPPPLQLEFRPEIRTVDGNPDPDPDETPFNAGEDEFEEGESD